MASLRENSEGEPIPDLVSICLQAALSGEFWRVQRRQLAYLPDEVANALLAGLLAQRRLEAPQLELFQHSASVVEVDGEAVRGSVGADWLAYLAKFRALHQLHLLRCPKLRDAHMALLAPLAPTLRVLSLAGCTGLSAGAAVHLAQLTGLQSLDLTDTHMGPPTANCLSGLSSLTALHLGGLPTSDDCCIALARLSGLRHLVLWGSEVGDRGMRELEHLSQLTALDLSLTQCSSPPLLPTLRHLSMVHCQLDVAGEDREALWLDMGVCLPSLEELNLQSASLAQPRGAQLLAQLAGGAACTLRHLNLGTTNVAELSFLEHCSALTYLDLSGAPVHDSHSGSLSLLPLAHLSLADTGVSNDGVAPLLAMTNLTHLDLRNSLVGDGVLCTLAQLPVLGWLDLSGTDFAGNLFASDLPGPLASLTALSLLNSCLGDRGCKLLAAVTPSLRQLLLGSSLVTDVGLKAVARLSALTRLELDGCNISDHGMATLRELGALRQLSMANCWLVGEAGFVDSLSSLPRLEVAQLNGVPLLHPAAAAAAPGTPSSPAGQRLGPGAQRRQQRRSLGMAAAAPASPAAQQRSGGGGGGSAGRRSGPSKQQGGRVGRLPEHVLEYDERLRYSREELLAVQESVECAGQRQQWRQEVLAGLPPELAAARTQ